jgi:alpha-galactosidase
MKALLLLLTALAGPAAAQVAVPDNRAYILTPPASPKPRINGPSVFGVRPGSPLLYHVPVTGDRPMAYAAKGLPDGVTLDAKTGQITGSVAEAGTYEITLTAKNARGKAKKAFRLKVGDEIALTPPMGWNSYNVWSDQVDQDKALAAAKAMVSSGLIEHGWTYINMDDGWQGTRGGPLNALQPNAERFPDFKGMVDQIHGMGLKVGLYSSPWVETYANRLGDSAENPQGARQDWPAKVPHNKKQFPYAIGHFRFFKNDAQQFAEWGVDYLKYDWGPVEYPEAKDMSDALRAQKRDIVYSLSNNHERNMFADIGRVSTVANAWRTTTDINDNWKRVADDIGFNQTQWAPFAQPGHFNDADMMVIGVVGWGKDKQHYTRLTPDEQYSHVSLWALLASPMLLGNDLTQLDPFTLSLLSNDEVIAIDQDALVKPATPVRHDGPGDIYARPLEDGSHAVGLFNRGAEPAEIEVKWSDLGLASPYKVRDLWRQKDLGYLRNGFTASVAPHGVVLIIIR